VERGKNIRARFLGPWVALVLLAALAGCDTSGPTPTAEKPLAESNKAPAASVAVPPAPPIYATGMTLQQGREAQKIGVQLAMIEGQLVGDGDEDPLWNYSDLFDDPQMANAIDLALLSKNNAKVMQLGGQRAVGFVERLEALNAFFSDLPAAGIPKSPIRYVSSGQEFRYQIALEERRIGWFLRAYPEISRAYIKWLFKVADIADPNKAANGAQAAP
jgi:hypothetical protein